MTDHKRVLIVLMRGANRRRKLALDEGEIIGWATHEDGQHYPIHAAQGGGGGSSGASSGGGKSSGGGSGGKEKSAKTGTSKSKSYRVTTPDGVTLEYATIPGKKDEIFNMQTNETFSIKGGIKAIQERAKNKGWKIEEFEEKNNPASFATYKPEPGSGKAGRLARWGFKNNYRAGII